MSGWYGYLVSAGEACRAARSCWQSPVGQLLRGEIRSFSSRSRQFFKFTRAFFLMALKNRRIFLSRIEPDTRRWRIYVEQ